MEEKKRDREKEKEESEVMKHLRRRITTRVLQLHSELVSKVDAYACVAIA